MEPKPTFTWKDYGRGRITLSVDDGRYDNHGIVIYKPASVMWIAVEDYEFDYMWEITRGKDLEAVKEKAEKHWFKCYLRRFDG